MKCQFAIGAIAAVYGNATRCPAGGQALGIEGLACWLIKRRPLRQPWHGHFLWLHTVVVRYKLLLLRSVRVHRARYQTNDGSTIHIEVEGAERGPVLML